jgi:hypothetical protein
MVWVNDHGCQRASSCRHYAAVAEMLVHCIENITSNIGKIEFPNIQIISYEIMGKYSQKCHYILDKED